MTRRVLLAIPLAACCAAADAAASLSAGNATLFLRAFDPAMPGYAKLRENVTGLVAQGEVQSLIEPGEDEGDDRRRAAEFQWTLILQRGQEAAGSVRRQEVVKCKVEKQAGKWRIIGLEPIEFFAPLR